MMSSINEVWDAFWKQENDDEKRYALTLSILMFGMLPAFLELIDTFIGNGGGNQMKPLLLLCTIASYTILGAATWRMTRFMREGAKDSDALFRCGLCLFCIKAVVLSVLLLQYQHHLDKSDVVLVKLTCRFWTMSGLVAAAGSLLNIMLFRLFVQAGIKEHKKEKERLCQSYFASSNYGNPELRMHYYLSAMLCGLSFALLLGFVDIAFHAYFKYDEPWMAALVIFACMALVVTAILSVLSMLLPVGHAVFFMPCIFFFPWTLGYVSKLADFSMDHHDRTYLIEFIYGLTIILMCHVSYQYAFGRI